MENEKIIETTEENRGYKLCRCASCGIVARCTPLFDFYSTEETEDKIICEDCFREYLYKKLQDEKRTQRTNL